MPDTREYKRMRKLYEQKKNNKSSENKTTMHIEHIRLIQLNKAQPNIKYNKNLPN